MATPSSRPAVWFYPEPYEFVADIAGHVAFYTDRVEVVVGIQQS